MSKILILEPPRESRRQTRNREVFGKSMSLCLRNLGFPNRHQYLIIFLAKSSLLGFRKLINFKIPYWHTANPLKINWFS